MKVQTFDYVTDNRHWKLSIVVSETKRGTEMFVDVLRQNKNGSYRFVADHDTQPLYLMQRLQYILGSLPVGHIDKLYIQGIKPVHSETYRVNFNNRIAVMLG